MSYMNDYQLSFFNLSIYKYHPYNGLIFHRETIALPPEDG